MLVCLRCPPTARRCCREVLHSFLCSQITGQSPAFYYDDQKWFRHRSSIVSFQTGMVLQVSEANQPVILAPYNSMEIKQEWTFLALAENKKAIVSSYNNLRLDQLEDSYQKVRVIIGVKEKHEEDTQEWTVDVL